MLARAQRGCPPWPGTTEISRACLHTAVSSQAPPEQAQSPRSLPACAHSKELLCKHWVHSWNRKDLRRVRAEAESLRKQKHSNSAQVLWGSASQVALEEPEKPIPRSQTTLSVFTSSRESWTLLLQVTHVIQEPGEVTQ